MIQSKLILLLQQLNHGLVDREATMKLALLSILAGENILLIGPPGTAKSLVARRISKSFAQIDQTSETTYFEYLLTKFSTPEEIFGPLSISELKADRFKRNTVGYLPSVEIAFLDEVFKASSSILNSLLTIMNERVYHNGTEALNVPLRALIAASNELPTGQEELSALYDRFLFRSFVDYINSDKLQHLFELSNAVEIKNYLTQEDFSRLDETIASITISPDIKNAILDIWNTHKDAFKEDRREVLSDRRFIKIIKILRVSAVTNGRNEVDLSDILLLKDCLWNHPDNIKQIQEIVLNTLRKYSHLVEINQENLAVPPVIELKSSQQQSSSNIIKGYQGSGTQNDPLLISNTDELLGLNRQDIGTKGLYLKQTQDIDCSILNSFILIPFTGHYDGNNFSITGEDCRKALFSKINPKSSVSNLQLINLALANEAEGAHIQHCMVDGSIINEAATECTIHDCITEISIAATADNCTIERCQTQSALMSGYVSEKVIIESYVKNSQIIDCIINLNTNTLREKTNKFQGLGLSFDVGDVKAGMAELISDKSKVIRCIVTSSKKHNATLHGFSRNLQNSEISNSACGPLVADSYSALISEFDTTSVLNNNASIDSIDTPYREDNANGKDGKKIPTLQFNQYFFEHTLNWDFDKIWQWDSKTNLPSLRKVKLEKNETKSVNNGNSTIELLALQIQSNIWV
ncbi:AAA family ATPase [Shewanella algicola]|uniref:AAA family ATPase n=1 Tax=Shewanella algicola TaxID=640633 RepID=UPI0024940F1A|nr:AAA family ATPase [Shewanella algicola]